MSAYVFIGWSGKIARPVEEMRAEYARYNQWYEEQIATRVAGQGELDGLLTGEPTDQGAGSKTSVEDVLAELGFC